MKRDEQGLKKAASLQFSERGINYQVAQFICYVLHLPKTVQEQFVPYVDLLRAELNNVEHLKQKLIRFQKQIITKRTLPPSFQDAKTYIRVFQKTYTAPRISEWMTGKFEQKVKQLQKSAQFRLKFQKKQQVYPDKIQKTDCIHPEFQTFFKLSKQFGQHSLSHHDRKSKQSVFYSPSRFIMRLQQIAHYQSEAQNLGNVLFLTYEGSKITGNKGYAVINDNKIQWWQKRANQAPQISIGQDQKDEKDKQDQSDEKQVKKPSRSMQKFKLAYQFIGHVQKITSVSVSYDQLFMLSTGVDRCIKLWCLRLKTQLTQYYGHMGTVWDVQFAFNGYYFVSGSADKMAILWKTDVPTPQRIFQHPGQVLKVKFLKNPDYVATACQDGIFRIWKILSGDSIREIAFNTAILNFDISFSGAYAGIYQKSGVVTVYDLSKGEKISSFGILQSENTTNSKSSKEKNMKPHDIAFSEDQKQLAVVSSKHIMLYSMEQLSQKAPSNIYELQKKQQKKQPPKQVIYMGRDVNITYCKYTLKNLLVVAGTKNI